MPAYSLSIRLSRVLAEKVVLLKGTALAAASVLFVFAALAVEVRFAWGADPLQHTLKPTSLRKRNIPLSISPRKKS
jgi:hypothetical protein